jgi:predicted ATPase/class 3 adenylate cyclase
MLPVGTVTFIFTDIEGSTRLWEKQPGEMRRALALHDSILRKTIEKYQGQVIKSTGDGIHAVFPVSLDAVKSAVDAQLQFKSPLAGLKLKIRIGVHTGEAEFRQGDYFGAALNRAARLMSVAHGGQILLSNATMQLVQDQLPENMHIRDLGEHRLRDLVRPEHIYQISQPGMEEDFPPLETIDSIPNNLPVLLTSFIGREKEIADVRNLLDTARLVTLTGSGGTGKTRLSLEISAEILNTFPDGAWLIELASITDPEKVYPQLAQTFGLQEFPDIQLSDIVKDYLRDKKILLILDNCEHLISTCASLAEDLLQHCAGLKILASSREALGISGEIAYHTPSLGKSESASLFVVRARAIHPDFSLDDSISNAVDQICTRLDGIPLAIELAAARIRLFSPEQIASRLDDLFRLLVGGSRTALPRQQTLRALIDWSYDLLSSPEQKLLRTISVFVGGWTIEALEAVSENYDAPELLELLIGKSLVITRERNGEMRYFMLETIRQYAREKLFEAHETAEVRDRHFSYYDELSEKIWTAFRSMVTFSMRDRMDDEMENFRSAYEWGLEHDQNAGIHIAANLCLATSFAGTQTEGLVALLASIERLRGLPEVEGAALILRQKLLAKALFVNGMITLEIGTFGKSVQVLEEAISLSRITGDNQMLGYSLEMYFINASFMDLPDLDKVAEEAYQIFERLDDPWGLGMALINMARIASLRGDYDKSQEYFNRARETAGNAPASVMVGMNYMNMGYADREIGRLESAREKFEAGLRIFTQLRHKVFITVLSSELGHIARAQGDFSNARQIYRETLRNFKEFGNRPAVAHQLECFGQLYLEDGDLESAARLFGAASALRERVDSHRTDLEQEELDRAVTRIRDGLVDGTYDSLWEQGGRMTMDEAVILALA